MERKSSRIWLMGLAVAGAAAGFFLRRWQLGNAFDAQGLILSGQPSSWALGAMCALVAVVFAVFCAGLTKEGTYMQTFSSAGPHMVVSALGALLLLAGCALQIMEKPTGIALVLGFLGVLAGLCILVTAVGRFRGSVPPVAAHFAPCVYLVVKLIVDFKHWSTDPAILDYCFHLFAAIAAMCATYHLSGFCFDKGGRRMSAFWCLIGTLMTGVCLADGGMVNMLLLGGLGLWMASNAWQLLQD